ncbi:hypothetical protein OTK49_02715 [Vibrio coralliirubri]|uniref:hypothetical protein n=1 Tax=Vibrio coralliirubri TaxID=1516159 RepID=UPI002283F1C6|nr:hypothetical protein [Vibrio coralliirubri]MCY9861430.1 hypothetical protein [Vibrio coralliirubri]
MNELFQGASLYSADEIRNACKVFKKVSAEYKKAVSDANDYANDEQKKQSINETIVAFLRKLKGNDSFWWQKYRESYSEFENQYENGLIFSCMDYGYSVSSIAVSQLLTLSKGDRECYLNPDQVKVIEMTRKHWGETTNAASSI